MYIYIYIYHISYICIYIYIYKKWNGALSHRLRPLGQSVVVVGVCLAASKKPPLCRDSGEPFVHATCSSALLELRSLFKEEKGAPRHRNQAAAV